MPTRSLTTFSIGQSGTETTSSVGIGTDVDPSLTFPPQSGESLGHTAGQNHSSKTAPQETSLTAVRREGSLETRAFARPSVWEFAQHVLVETKLTPATGIRNGSALHSRQLWEGIVQRVGKTDFVAVVRDKTNPTHPDEEVAFDLGEVPHRDRALLTPGAAFYWFIGAEHTAAGNLKNVSVIQFKRLPKWSKGALLSAAARSKRYASLLSEPE